MNRSDPSTAQISRIRQILGLCARVKPLPLQQAHLAELCAGLGGEPAAWQNLAREAEEHGMAPLLHLHLNAAGFTPPLQARRELAGLALRHRLGNQEKLKAAAEILAELCRAGIETILLKGAALARMVYPEPGLRPMRDLDLLVRSGDLSEAGRCLERLGYQVEASDLEHTPQDHHHLPGYYRETLGSRVCVEMHHNLFPPTRHYRQLGFAELYPRAIAIELEGQPALAPGLEEMLYHIYRHASGPPLLTTPLRFISAADMIGLVEKFADQIDWGRLRTCYGQVQRVLPLLDDLGGWDESLRAQFDLPPAAGQSTAALEEYRGWPRQDRRRGGQSWENYLGETLFPPEWWLRFFYGVGRGRALSYHWHRWVRHPLHLLEWQAARWKESGFAKI